MLHAYRKQFISTMHRKKLLRYTQQCKIESLHHRIELQTSHQSKNNFSYENNYCITRDESRGADFNFQTDFLLKFKCSLWCPASGQDSGRKYKNCDVTSPSAEAINSYTSELSYFRPLVTQISIVITEACALKQITNTFTSQTIKWLTNSSRWNVVSGSLTNF